MKQLWFSDFKQFNLPTTKLIDHSAARLENKVKSTKIYTPHRKTDTIQSENFHNSIALLSLILSIVTSYDRILMDFHLNVSIPSKSISLKCPFENRLQTFHANSWLKEKRIVAVLFANIKQTMPFWFLFTAVLEKILGISYSVGAACILYIECNFSLEILPISDKTWR